MYHTKQEGEEDETHSDFEHTDFTEYREKGWLRRVPDFLSVFLHGRKPNL